MTRAFGKAIEVKREHWACFFAGGGTFRKDRTFVMGDTKFLTQCQIYYRGIRETWLIGKMRLIDK